MLPLDGTLPRLAPSWAPPRFQAKARIGLPGAPALAEAYRGEHPALFCLGPLSGRVRDRARRYPYAAVKVIGDHDGSNSPDQEERCGVRPDEQANFARRNRDPNANPCSFHDARPCG